METHSHTWGDNPCAGMFLGGGTKPELLQGTHMDMGSPNILHKAQSYEEILSYEAAVLPDALPGY